MSEILSVSSHQFLGVRRCLGSDTRATPGSLAKNISLTYSPEIHGWDSSWLELLVARLPPSSNHSSSSSQLKFQPYISGEYIGLMFLARPLYEWR